jgi:hypothetical protein
MTSSAKTSPQNMPLEARETAAATFHEGKIRTYAIYAVPPPLLTMLLLLFFGG